jgi:hypothetical protein
VLGVGTPVLLTIRHVWESVLTADRGQRTSPCLWLRFLLAVACVIISSMGNQTYQKRQKELARQQKQRDKFARRQQRKAEKKKGGPPLEGGDSVGGEIRLGSQAFDPVSRD